MFKNCYMMMANTDGSSLNGSFMILVGSIKLWQIRLVVTGKLVTKSARSHLTWTHRAPPLALHRAEIGKHFQPKTHYHF